jgi:hypothetical protein
MIQRMVGMRRTRQYGEPSWVRLGGAAGGFGNCQCQKRQNDPRDARNIEGKAPSVGSGEPTAEEIAEKTADRQTQHKKRKCPATMLRRVEITNE